MKAKSYKKIVVLCATILTLFLFLIIFLKQKKSLQRQFSFFNQVITLNEKNVDFNTLTPLEYKVLKKFNSIPVEEYSFRYKEIAENNRVFLNSPIERDIGVYILKKLLASNRLDSQGKLFILNKLIVLISSSENIVDTIKLTIEYLNLAEDSKSNLDIMRAKLSLSSIFTSLGGYETSIDILNTMDITNQNFPEILRIKSSLYLYLSENYYFLKKYDLALETLTKIPRLENEPLEYKKNMDLLIEIFKARIYTGLNNKNLAKLSIEKSSLLIDSLKKFYFTDLKTLYMLTNENYNLKYDFENFKLSNIKDFIDKSNEYTDINLLKNAFSIEFEYYSKINDFNSYKDLNIKFDNFLNEINISNNKVFSLYLIKNLEIEYFTKENENLYKEIFFLIAAMLLILTFSYNRIDFLDNKSKIDDLTKIGNRLSFNTKTSSFKDNDYSMLLFDIDNFKNINDTYGHEFGDEVLSTIGKILKTIENKEITIYRVGGEEFAIIFNHLNKNFAIESCEYIRKSIENIHWINPITVTISGGFAISTKNIYAECDTRLYKAKNSGKNMIIYQTVDNGGF